MRVVTVRYHHEPEGWWAETDDLPNYSAAGASYEEVRDLVFRGLPELLHEPLDIREDLSEAGIVVPVVFLSDSATLPQLSMRNITASLATSINRRLIRPLVAEFRAGTAGMVDRNERLNLT